MADGNGDRDREPVVEERRLGFAIGDQLDGLTPNRCEPLKTPLCSAGGSLRRGDPMGNRRRIKTTQRPLLMGSAGGQMARRCGHDLFLRHLLIQEPDVIEDAT